MDTGAHPAYVLRNVVLLRIHRVAADQIALSHGSEDHIV